MHSRIKNIKIRNYFFRDFKFFVVVHVEKVADVRYHNSQTNTNQSVKNLQMKIKSFSFNV